MDSKIIGISVSMTIILIFVSFYLGTQAGKNKTTVYYQEKISNISQDYIESVERARQIELKWKAKADELELEYKKKLHDSSVSNDAIINQLRLQLDKATKQLSSNSNSSSKSDEVSRRADVSERIKGLVDFSDRCARRHDELVIQVNALQSWINKEVQ